MPYTTRINRNTNDYTLSPIEQFYHTFNKPPLFYFSVGITDPYDHPARVRLFLEPESYNSLEIIERPDVGSEQLEKFYNEVVDVLFEHEIIKSKTPASDSNLCNGEWFYSSACSYDRNIFHGMIILPAYECVVNFRVIPTEKTELRSINIFSNSNTSKVWNIITKYGEKYKIAPQPDLDKINIIAVNSSGDFYLQEAPLKDSSKKIFSYNHYNEDFENPSTHIIQQLQYVNQSGLVLLHGDTGTGKTTYLRYLLHTVKNKKLIYMPPDMTSGISSPGFISFLMSNATNSILLIEDAENVLRHRQAGGNQAVSNILNVSDGILGDLLRLQIVCTFNCALNEIDEALLRPGRLIAEYRFNTLSEERTRTLMQSVYGKDVEIPKNKMTLAEIFCHRNMPIKTKISKVGLGFTGFSE